MPRVAQASSSQVASRCYQNVRTRCGYRQNIRSKRTNCEAASAKSASIHILYVPAAMRPHGRMLVLDATLQPAVACSAKW